MKQLLRKKWIAALVPAFVLTAAAVILAQLLLRNFSLFLSFDPMFSRIFSQLRYGDMDTKAVLLCAAAYAFSLVMISLRERKRRRLMFAVGMAVFFLVLTVAAMLLTCVNGVLFGDIVVSLLDVLRKGGLDGL